MRDLIAALHARMSAHPEAPALAGPPLKAVRIDNAADEATVWVYDVIGDWGVSAAELVPAIESISAPAITVRVNSPGGDYFDGVAIANALARHPAAVTVHVDGLAASAASVIAMAGDESSCTPAPDDDPRRAHDDHRQRRRARQDRALLDSASQDIAALYAARAGGDAGHWRTAMLAETWYDRRRPRSPPGSRTRRPSRTVPPRGDAALADRAAGVPRSVHTGLRPVRPLWTHRPPRPRSPRPRLFHPTPAPRRRPDLSEQLCSAFREAIV
jgi:hypothetical protein